MELDPLNPIPARRGPSTSGDPSKPAGLDTAKITAIKHLWWDAIDYRPNPEQEKVHADFHRVRLVSGGEGSGKSYLTAKEYMGWHALLPLTYIVAPKYQSGRPEFEYITSDLMKLGHLRQNDISQPTQGQMSFHDMTGNELVVISSEDGPKAITGTGRSPDAILMVEAGKQSYDIFLACRARIARSRGFLLMSGTIEQSERWYPELVNRWQTDNPEGARSFILPTWTNTALYPLGMDDPEIILLRNTFTPELFQERFGAVPCPPVSLVFKEFSFSTHVNSSIQFDSTADVQIWVDPGYSGSHYAVLFVQLHSREYTRRIREYADLPDSVGSDVHVVDELYLDHATHAEVIKAAMEKELWKNVKSGVGDIVMRTHPQAGESPVQIWASPPARIALRSRAIRVDEGIDRQHTFLKDPANGSPRIFFNPKCKGALKEYGQWRRKEIGENEYGKPETTFCDSLKAINYGLIVNFGFVDRTKDEEPFTGLYMEKQFKKRG